MSGQLNVIAVGGGHRSAIKASLPQTRPDMMQIVGIAVLNELRCGSFAGRYRFAAYILFSAKKAFSSVFDSIDWFLSLS